MILNCSTKTDAAIRRGLLPRTLAIVCAVLLTGGMTGCTTLLSPISGIPAHRVPCQFLGEPRANLKQVDLSRLRQDPPDEYRLGPKDVLGVFIEGVLGDKDEQPPVHFPEDGNREPALGFPVPIREDKTIALPLIPPLRITDKTLSEAQEMILSQYVERKILNPDSRIIVTLMRPRTYKVIVIRQDQGGGINNNLGNVNNFVRGSSQLGSGREISLPAYENDVLHALAATGGLPGLDAKNEVKILRGKFSNAKEREEFLKSMWERERGKHPDPCICEPPLLEDPTIIRIPLRLPPGEFLDLKPEDVILEQGDIVLIESRETEVFYTGGLLGGREIPLPRDYDLDILGAIALAGGTLGQNQGSGLGGLSGGLGGAAPSNAFVLRPLACGGQMTIVVDLNRALSDPATRILIQPKDTVILRYKPREELVNFGIATFFIQGIQRIFQNR